MGEVYRLVQLQRRQRPCPCQHSNLWWNSRKFLYESVTRHLSFDQVVNDEFLGHVRDKHCTYIRGDTQRLTREGVLVSVRSRGSKPGDKGEEQEFKGDVVVMATGFERPDLKFMEGAELFPEGYEVRYPDFLSLMGARLPHSDQICICKTSRRRTGRF